MKKIHRLFVSIGVGVITLSLLALAVVHGQARYYKHSSPQIKINRQIKKMSWRQKVGQMFVTDLPNNNAEARYDVKHYHLGGVILNTNNFNGKQTTKYHNYVMQKASHHSLLIGTDQEGGEVSRLGINHYKYPSPQQAYRRGGMKGIQRAYRYSAKQMRHLGLNWNYAPDADVSNPGTSMYPRTFGHGYHATARYIHYAVPAIQHQKIGATLKHFPGYGNVPDTDYHVAKSNRSYHYLKNHDFLPFEAGIKSHADSVMITNIILSQIRHNIPASLSKTDVSLLRKNLHFNGVIVTDSLQAQAIQQYGYHHSIMPDYLAMRAGNDMIMSDNYRRAIPKLTKDIKTGKISKRQVNHSVARILMMKYKLGLNY